MDIKDFLQEGQQVKVKVISIDQAGRINLSIKKAQPHEPRHDRAGGHAGPRQPRFQQRTGAPRSRTQQAPKDPAAMSFEDKLKAFMSDSESRQGRCAPCNRSQERFAQTPLNTKTEGDLGFVFMLGKTVRFPHSKKNAPFP